MGNILSFSPIINSIYSLIFLILTLSVLLLSANREFGDK